MDISIEIIFTKRELPCYYNNVFRLLVKEYLSILFCSLRMNFVH